MFVVRTISGAALLVLMIITGWIGGLPLLLTLLVISLIGMREYMNAVRVSGSPVSAPEIFVYAGAAVYYALLYFERTDFLLPSLAVTLMALLVVQLFLYRKHSPEEMAGVFFSLLYVAFMLSFVYLTRDLFKGQKEVWLIFFGSWGADTCAYLVGSLFGRHKMTPVLSPKKSLEGALGGLAGAALLSLIFALIWQQPVGTFILVGVAGAVASIFGDLAASAIKRSVGIKDFGRLIPGHGGILDRYDSVIFTAPVVYLLAVLFLG